MSQKETHVMKDEIFKTILGIVKGSVLLVVAGAVFYCIYPKYTIHFKSNPLRFNQITGQIDLIDDDGNWESFQKHYTKKT